MSNKKPKLDKPVSTFVLIDILEQKQYETTSKDKHLRLYEFCVDAINYRRDEWVREPIGYGDGDINWRFYFSPSDVRLSEYWIKQICRNVEQDINMNAGMRFSSDYQIIFVDKSLFAINVVRTRRQRELRQEALMRQKDEKNKEKVDN